MKSKRLPILALTATLVFCGAASAQQGAMITPNYKDADLGQIIEAVSQVTGKNFIVDPRVRAQVTMLSSTPMSPAAFYQAFLSILQVHGFVAVPAGKVIKIVPDANARQMPGDDLPDQVSATSDEIVTQVVQVKNISAAQLVPILRPLIPQYGHLAAYPASNMLIISDRASNVNRMVRIIQRLDDGGGSDIDIVRLEHASADEVVRVVNALTGVQGAEAGNTVKIVADERTNSVLLSGEPTQRLRIRALITHLDTPLQTGGDTQVRYLRYADAEKLAAKLKEQAQGLVAAAAGGAGAAPAAGAASAAAGKDRDVTIWAEPQTNALVITAPPKIMSSLMRVIDQLDIRRAQVLIEAMLVEVSADASRDLGVNWIVDGSNNNFLVGLFNQPIGGISLADVANGINNPSNITQQPNGLTVGVGRKEATGTNFAAILRALSSDGNTNVVSMPSVITLDNEEAKIEVAQEVPFITGSYATTGGTGTVNPFTTVQRKEVGNILKITPQITDENTILLKIDQEASGIAAAAQQVSTTDLVTNKRTISTRVLVDDGGMIVLGGLIEDRLTETNNKVPLLGDIPLLGELFRVRSTQKTKTDLLIFIRPRIIRDAQQAALETNAKYNFIRNLQLGRSRGKVQLMPGAHQPVLPALEGPTAPAAPVPGMNAAGTPPPPAPAPAPAPETTPPAATPAQPPSTGAPGTAPEPAATPPKGT